jgi:hypothetical protein
LISSFWKRKDQAACPSYSIFLGLWLWLLDENSPESLSDHCSPVLPNAHGKDQSSVALPKVRGTSGEEMKVLFGCYWVRQRRALKL